MSQPPKTEKSADMRARSSPARSQARSSPARSRSGLKQYVVKRYVVPSRSWRSRLLLGLVGLGLAVFVSSAGWLAVQLIVNPQTLLWINQYAPGWIPIPVTGLKPPQTMSEIRSELQQSGRAGEPIVLGKNVSVLDARSSVTDLVLPVIGQQPNCQTECDRVVELRLYQSTPSQTDGPREPSYQLINQLAIAGLEEAFVVAPLVEARSGQGSTRSLPLSRLAQFESTTPSQGVWLNLSGQWQRGDERVTYGQVIHYNSSKLYLGSLLSWTSPAGQEPTWQEVTGGKPPELVVNQTIGLEPAFQVYQVKPRSFASDPIQLEPILIAEAAIDHLTYQDGLLLARNGLWSLAGEWLKSAHKKTAWSAAADAQMALIQRHAEATQAQAERSWASPGQQVLANLIDGRWAKALQVFQVNADNSRDTAALLRSDSGRLQKRIDTALKVNPTLEARLWGALLLAAKYDRATAIAGFKKQFSPTAAALTRVNQLINRLDAAFSDPSPTARRSQFLGAVQPIGRVAAEWQQPESTLNQSALKLEDGQSWYVLKLARFHDGNGWRSPGALADTASAETIWKRLGSTDPSLQLVFWQADGQQQSRSASVKAARVRAGNLQLLLASDALAEKLSDRPHPIAFTDATIQWLTLPTRSLSEQLQQPGWAKKAMPVLLQELRRSRPAITWDELNQLGAGSWPVQIAPLTGREAGDVVLTVPPSLTGDLPRSIRPRSLIVSAAGTLIYSEFSTDAAAIHLAIADLQDGGSPVLVVDEPDNYALLRWSASHKRFESVN